MMRKAAEFYARGKGEKAHGQYAKAAAAYLALAEPPVDRVALALYTRAHLTVSGECPTGNATEEIAEGLKWVDGRTDDASLRFHGLLLLLRATHLRQTGAASEGEAALGEARMRLERSGTPFDVFVLELEQGRVHLAAGRIEAARAAMRAALDRTESPHQRITARRLMAEVCAAADDWRGAHAELTRAAGDAYDNGIKTVMKELESEIEELERAHPEASGGEAS